MTLAKDLSGVRFTRLVAIERIQSLNSRAMWRCRCDCGSETVVRGTALTTGNSRSCGCLVRDSMAAIGRSNATHGQSGTVEYNSWSAMLDRCYDKKNNRYRLYGAHGVVVCNRWRNSFENFLADMGRRPTAKHSLDRWPNTNGNYEPTNCRWATASQQNKNRRPFKRRLQS